MQEEMWNMIAPGGRTRPLRRFAIRVLSSAFWRWRNVMLFRYRFVAAFWRLCSGILLEDCFVVRLRGGCLRSAPVRSGASQFALWASADDRLRHGDAIINAISSRSREGPSIYRVIGTRRDVTIICQTTWRLILLHLLDATH